jgi:peptidyl-prolyl cis-trans isomerase C
MNRKLLVAALITLSAAFAQTAFGAGAALATVNGKAIPQARFDAVLASLVAEGKEDTPQLRNAIKANLIRQEVVVQAAEKKKLDKKPEVEAQMMMARQNVLVGAYLNDFVKSHPVTDAMLKKEYDKTKQALGDKEYKVRHILVDTEDQAKAIIADLKKGQKFEDLAKQSKDTGSKDRGGELGWANKTAYVKPFADAMMKLKKGEYTETPVKTNFGWHVIKLDDVREMKVPPMDDVKTQLKHRLQQEMVAKQVSDLVKRAKVH